MATIRQKDLLGIETLTPEEIQLVLDTAESFVEVSRRAIKKVPTLRGKTVVNFFCEPSTRTRSSFEIAERRLTADAINFSTSLSSLSKGETLIDTARNLEAMNPDIIIIRHQAAGAPHMLARWCRASVVNAGDGVHEHPTQALLDAFTIRRHKGELKGLRVAIVGDIAHSRVARSNVLLLTRMGVEVVLCAPPTLLPFDIARMGVTIEHDLDRAVEGCDVVMMLRLQRERMRNAVIPSMREYFNLYGLTRARLARAKDDAIVMHPGPMNRGVEIASDVADGPASVILEQVSNGVAVRMAVLYLLSGAKSLPEADA